jgi:hypothetical protein
MYWNARMENITSVPHKIARDDGSNIKEDVDHNGLVYTNLSVS